LLLNERTRALSGLVDEEAPNVICLIVGLPVRGEEANIISWCPEIERFHLLVIGSNDSPCLHIIIGNKVIPDWLFFTVRLNIHDCVELFII
jgi:hypothetical protein